MNKRLPAGEYIIANTIDLSRGAGWKEVMCSALTASDEAVLRLHPFVDGAGADASGENGLTRSTR